MLSFCVVGWTICVKFLVSIPTRPNDPGAPVVVHLNRFAFAVFSAFFSCSSRVCSCSFVHCCSISVAEPVGPSSNFSRLENFDLLPMEKMKSRKWVRTTSPAFYFLWVLSTFAVGFSLCFGFGLHHLLDSFKTIQVMRPKFVYHTAQ